MSILKKLIRKPTKNGSIKRKPKELILTEGASAKKELTKLV